VAWRKTAWRCTRRAAARQHKAIALRGARKKKIKSINSVNQSPFPQRWAGGCGGLFVTDVFPVAADGISDISDTTVTRPVYCFAVEPSITILCHDEAAVSPYSPMPPPIISCCSLFSVDVLLRPPVLL